MKQSTIQRAIRRLQSVVDDPRATRQEQDQAYGAAEALRWVIGDGPPLRDFMRPAAAVSPPAAPTTAEGGNDGER